MGHSGDAPNSAVEVSEDMRKAMKFWDLSIIEILSVW